MPNKSSEDKLRVPYRELIETLETMLLAYGFGSEPARLSATLFAKASLDGVASHGLNRFLPFLKTIDDGYVNVDAEPTLSDALGSFERWDGNLGPGNLNAHHGMGRAIALAKKHGMGCVALKNTNHWMRGGNFGWQAVEKGCIGICFTNTKPNMPAWGSDEPRLGNNPVVIAVPREDGPVVLDMALAQFSYGKMDSYARKNEPLPYDGGFDSDGNISRNPTEILEAQLPLPIGLWKGAGMSLMVDIIASALSEGKATHQIGEEEYAISQFFLCFNPEKLGVSPVSEEKLDAIIDNLKSSSAIDGANVRYPGEATLSRREQNLEQGVPVDKSIWERIVNQI
jgi:3-dehydro-L-gulonate 2-dehydrogenase